MKTAAAYIRVSTEDQIEYSPDSQLKCITEFAKKNGYILSKDYIFQDDGISGRSAKKRPAFNKMIAQSKIKPVPFETILVWKFSRFARNQEESIFYKSMLRKNGIEVVSISEPVTSGPFGDLIERIIEWSDEYYSIRLSGEVKRGMTEKVSRGEAVSVPAYGYDIIDKEYVINETEAKFIRLIFDEFAAGTSYRELAVKLNALGVKSHRGNPFETRTIEYIINNPVYLGKIRWNPSGRTHRNYSDKNIVITDGKHKPIITLEQWDKAQEMSKKIKQMYKRCAKPSYNENMLQGLLHCSQCGSTMIKSGNYMQCCKYSKGTCNVSHSIPYETAVNKVISHIDEDFKTQKLKVVYKSAPSSEEYNYFVDLIKKEEKKLERVKQAYENEIDTLEEYKQNKKRITKTIENLKIRLNKTVPKNDVKNLTQKLIEKHKNAIAQLHDETLSASEKNKIMRTFVDKIIFEKATKNLDFYYYL